MRGLKDKSGIVTGGASGIGRAMCMRLAEEGCRVAVFDRNAELAEEAAETIRQRGGCALAVGMDVTSAASVSEAVARVRSEWGAIWFMVNGAGWDRPAPFLSTVPDDWAKVIDINLVGPMNMHRAVCPLMRDAGGGRIVNVASDAARSGATDVAVYSASKGGLISLTKSLARELARSDILINVISPGPTETPLFQSFVDSGPDGARWRDAVARTIPLGRLAVPEDYAGLAAFLISDDASYITGQTFSVSGGLTMA
jgi:2-hydroxycyclohexanecarboxyl-CoA dehydrogenase